LRSVPIAVPIRGSSGQTEGVLQASLSLTRLANTAAGVRLGGGRASIVEEGGTILLDADSRRVLGVADPDDVLSRARAGEEVAGQTADKAGVRYFSAAVPLRGG